MKSDFETWREKESERERGNEREKEISYNWNVLVIYAEKKGGGVCIWPAKIDFSREPIIYTVYLSEKYWK